MRKIVLAIMLVLPSVATAQMRPSKGQSEIEQAAERITRGDYVNAEPLLRRAITDDPNNPWGHFNLASVLRATGRNDEAILEYHRAKDIFESRPSANGEGDVGNCLYGIALAQEARGDAAESARAWESYVRFARPFAREQAGLAIAKNRVNVDSRLAREGQRIPGTPEAARSSVIR